MIDREKLIADAFFKVVGDIIDEVALGQLVEAIEQGNLDDVFRLMGVQPAVWEPLTDALHEAYKAAGVAFGATFPARLNGVDGPFMFRFSARNQDAENWLRQQSGRLITNITEDVRNVVREVARAGMEAGTNPRRVALDIVGRIDPITKNRVGGVIGLTESQLKWVNSVASKLRSLDSSYFDMRLRDKRFDTVVRKAIETGQPLRADKIEQLVSHYRAATLRYRATTIARSEMLQSQSAAEFAAVKQVVATGAVPADAVKRVWDSVEDANRRPSHRLMEGQTVGPNEPFVTPSGKRMMYPGDSSLGAPANELIMCRCRARPKINWLAGG